MVLTLEHMRILCNSQRHAARMHALHMNVCTPRATARWLANVHSTRAGTVNIAIGPMTGRRNQRTHASTKQAHVARETARLDFLGFLPSTKVQPKPTATNEIEQSKALAVNAKGRVNARVAFFEDVVLFLTAPVYWIEGKTDVRDAVIFVDDV